MSDLENENDENQETRTQGGARSPADTAPVPQWIGEYRILGVLGRGGMGVVYEAEQKSPTRVVALKVIRGESSIDDLHVTMFRREVEVLARLEHPMIARIYESGRTEEGRHFFAMEVVRGATLSAFLRARDARLDPAELRRRLAMFAAIADAVQYAHQRGVIHRDLKPSNLIVTEEGQLKILDFGLARITDGDVAASRVTEIGVIKGTLPYMSPEQARGKPDEIDVRTDVYALGVILHEMLTGKLPHDLSSVTIVEALRIIEQARTRPLREVWPGPARLDGDLETIVAKALEKEAKDRYGSAGTLAEDVRRYLASQPILARPPSTVYQLRKLVRRNPLATAFAASVLLLLVAFAGVMTYQARRIAEERDRARSAASRSEAVSGFLQQTLESSNPLAAGGKRDITIVEALDRSAGRIDKDFAGQPDLEAAVLETLGTTYNNLGQYDKSEVLLKRGLDLSKEHLGAESGATAAAWGRLSRLYHTTGRYDDAIKMAQAGIVAQRAAGPAKSPDLAERLNDLGYAYLFSGKPQEAEKPVREAVEIGRAQPGEPSRILAESLVLLGNVLAAEQKVDEGVALSKEGIEIFRKTTGEDNPDVDNAKNSLAMILLQKEDYAGAEKLMIETVASAKRQLGDEHPQVAILLENLGNVYYREGKLDRTIELLGESAAIRKKAFGPTDASVGRTLSNRGVVLWRSGRLAEAESATREGLALMQAGMGDHPDVAWVYVGLAGILAERKNLPGAEQALREVLRIRRVALGDKDRLTATSSIDLGLNLVAQHGKTPEARKLLQDGLAVLAPAAGENDPLVQSARKALG